MLCALLLSFSSLNGEVLLKRTFSAGEKLAYEVKLQIDTTNFGLSGRLAVLTKSLTRPGSANLILTSSDLDMQVNGADVPADPPRDVAVAMNAQGFPKAFGQQEKDLFATLFLASSVLPNETVTSHHPVKVSWKGDGGKGSIEGTITLREQRKAPTGDIAVLEDSLAITPNGDPSPAKFVFVAEIDVSTGRVLKSEGSLSISGNDGRFRLVCKPSDKESVPGRGEYHDPARMPGHSTRFRY